MTEIGKGSLDIGDVTKYPVHDINEVAELREQCSAIQVAASFPVTTVVIAVVAVPETIELHHVNITEQFIVDDFFQPDTWRTITVLHYPENVAGNLQCFVYDFFAICLCDCHWFLTNYVHP